MSAAQTTRQGDALIARISAVVISARVVNRFPLQVDVVILTLCSPPRRPRQPRLLGCWSRTRRRALYETARLGSRFVPRCNERTKYRGPFTFDAKEPSDDARLACICCAITHRR